MNLPAKPFPVRPRRAGALALGLLVWLGACASTPPAGPPRSAPPPVPDTLAQGSAAPLPLAPDGQAPESLERLLRFHQELRQMNAAQLSAVIAAIEGLPQGPGRSLRLAMALSQTRQSADLLQAQAHLDRLLSAGHAPAIQPLAELLASHLAEQRRLAEAQEKQAQHIKEQQKKIEQLTHKLDALKVIEQTLPAPASSLAPGVAPASALEGNARQVGS